MPVRRLALTSRAIVSFLLLAAAFLVFPCVALGAATGSGGWYWPVGTENFHGWDGYWEYRSSNHSWHMAQDMPESVGHPVYAVGDGVVLESKAGAGYNGVLVILHRTLEGTEFKAVYGHVIRKNLDKGDRVSAGQVIGKVNGSRHVHFGIHPGRKYPKDRNPYRGHTYTKKERYGWVDPVKFLRANPRFMTYKAPSLPRVTVVTSTVIPTFLGVAEKCVYFSLPTSEGTVASYHRPLAGGEPSQVPAGMGLPSLDATRFSAGSIAATSFTVLDRLPKLSARYSSRAPRSGRPIVVTGTLTNRGGRAFCGARVVLQRSVDGTSWATVGATTTGPRGKYWLRYTPDRRSAVRVRFAPAKTYLPARTAPATVAPTPGLGAPRVPKKVKADREFEVEGTLRVRHAAGKHSVTLEFQRLHAERWVAAFARRTTNRNENGATRYEGEVRLARGLWRVRAKTAADSAHAAEATRWLRIRSK